MVASKSIAALFTGKLV